MLGASLAWCAKPAVIPEIQEWTDGEGTYTLSESARVVIPPSASAELNTFAHTFADAIGRPMVKGKAKEGDIALSVKLDAKANPESYTLKASPKGISISAPTALGAFWGAQTVRQVFDLQGKTFPAGEAKDWPEYKVRGFMFDCGRKPFTLTTLRQLIDICSYYKMSELQLHLNDNYIWLYNYPNNPTPEEILKIEPSAGAFRLESKVKGLTATDLSYTKKEFRALVDEANAKGVQIVPEFDAPGHALAMIRVRPDLMYKGSLGRHKEAERAAMFDLTNPKSFQFIASIFDEYINGKVFPNEVVHIGADEYYGDTESYRKYLDDMLKHIQKRGKTPRLWGSFTQKPGKTPVISKGVQMNIWSVNWQNPRDAIKEGYDIINIVDTYTYIVPTGVPGKPGGYGDDIDSEWLYNNWTPALFKGLDVEPNHPQLLGGAWAVWNDHSFLTDPGLCGRDLLPRIQKNCATIAQKTWAKSNSRPYGDFFADIQKQAKVLDTEEPGEWSMSFTTGRTTKPLADGDETTLYAVSPVNGKVGFRREGAQYTFDYTIPEGKTVELVFHSAPRKAWLTVDGVEVGGTPVRQFYPEACKFYTLPKPQ